ncbi:hypothetical protein, partial [Kocuria rosea]|uniref:hypothetical protein n=1 Tax=Kocuria rosea TaxID=1275 RepID=UPI001643B614
MMMWSGRVRVRREVVGWVGEEGVKVERGGDMRGEREGWVGDGGRGVMERGKGVGKERVVMGAMEWMGMDVEGENGGGGELVEMKVGGMEVV